jgi:hypothetical protein
VHFAEKECGLCRVLVVVLSCFRVVVLCIQFFSLLFSCLNPCISLDQKVQLEHVCASFEITGHLHEVAAFAKIASRSRRFSQNRRENLIAKSIGFGRFLRTCKSRLRRDTYRLISVYKGMAAEPTLPGQNKA